MEAPLFQGWLNSFMTRRSLLYLLSFAILAGALIWGRTQAVLELDSPLKRVFPDATQFQVDQGTHLAYGADGALLGWAATGSANGYGGPMVLLVGIDTLGVVVGVEVVQPEGLMI